MKPTFKVPLTYGLIAGVLGAGLSIGLFYIGPHPFLIAPYADFRIILFAVFIFFTLKELRDHHQNGTLYFSQGFVVSFVFVAVYAMVASLVLGIFAALSESFVRDYIIFRGQQMRSLSADIIDRIGKEVYERNLAELPATNAFSLAITYFWQCFILGLFITIIMSVILRRQPNP
jgi:hypothetical protein